jgi:hypothetical protein
MARQNSRSRWTHIVKMISECPGNISDIWEDGNSPASDCAWPAGGMIRLLGRPSPDCVSLAWGHPCCGRYGDQIWRKVVARRSAVCALSGRPIRKGMRIYKLFQTFGNQRNRNEVLLAQLVDTAAGRCSNGVDGGFGHAEKEDTRALRHDWMTQGELAASGSA